MNKHMIVFFGMLYSLFITGSEKPGKEIMIHFDYWTLPPELRAKIGTDFSYYDRALHNRKNYNRILHDKKDASTLSKLSSVNLIQYSNFVLNTWNLNTDRSELKIEASILQQIIEYRDRLQCCDPIFTARISVDSISINTCKKELFKHITQQRCLDATHTVFIDAYVFLLRFFCQDATTLEYIARIVCYTRLSPQLITVLINEKIDSATFAQHVFGSNLTQICREKHIGKEFITDTDKTVHSQFRDICFKILIQDAIIPHYFLPMSCAVITTNKNKSHDYRVNIRIKDMQIDHHIPEQQQISHKIVSHHLDFVTIQRKNTSVENGNHSPIYCIDKKLVEHMIKGRRTDEVSPFSITTYLYDNEPHETQVLEVESYQYIYPRFITNADINNHIAVSYFMYRQKNICEIYGEKKYSDDYRILYNQEINILKQSLSKEEKLKPYLDCINPISNRIYWNVFKHNMTDLLKGTHTKLCIAASIGKYAGVLKAPLFINIVSIHSGLSVLKFSLSSVCYKAVLILFMWRIICIGCIALLPNIACSIPQLLTLNVHQQRLPVPTQMVTYTRKNTKKALDA